MKKNLTVNEKYSRHWPVIAVGSAVLAFLFYFMYHSVNNVLYEGYLRLTAFIFFALSILSFFKLRDGKIQISLEQKSDDTFEITYISDKRTLFQEEINKRDVSEITVAEMPNRSLYNDLVKSDRCIKIKKKDADHWIYLNSINGRVIPLTDKNASSMKTFIEEL